MSLWFRWYAGTTEDGKMRVVARRSRASLSEVLAVWAVLLEDASRPEHRGVCTRNEDFIAGLLDLEDETAERVLSAMQSFGMIDVGAGSITITRWHDRQYETDSTDPTNNERKRRFREKQKDGDGTEVERQGNDQRQRTDRQRTDTETETTVLKLHARSIEDEIDQIILAANRGMIQNPLIEDACQPIPISHGSRQDVGDWLRDGIPVEVCELACYARAKEYKPDGRHKRITTMRYFDGRVRQEWDKHRSQNGQAPAALPRQPVLGPVEKWISEHEEEYAAIKRSVREDFERNSWWADAGLAWQVDEIAKEARKLVWERIEAA